MGVGFSDVIRELDEFLSEFDKQIANFVEVTTISGGNVVVVKKLGMSRQS